MKRLLGCYLSDALVLHLEQSIYHFQQNQQNMTRICFNVVFVKTVPGTRSHHSFVPLTEDVPHFCRYSSTRKTIVNLHPDLRRQSSEASSHILYQLGLYIACLYDNQWHIGTSMERSEMQVDVKINFMRNSENGALSWPSIPDDFRVPFPACTLPSWHP